MKSLIRTFLALSALGVFFVLMTGGTAPAGENTHLIKQIAEGKIQPATLTTQTSTGQVVTRTMPFVSGSTINAARAALGLSTPDDMRAEEADAGSAMQLDGTSGAGGTTTGSGPAHSLGCGSRNAGPRNNFRVNQDCTFRRQAEEEIVYNPTDPNNLVAGQNDSRVGFNQCGFDWSTNNGKNWGDELPPFRQKVNNPAGEEPAPPGDPNRHTILGAANGPGTFHTYDAGSDPALAADALGRTYFSCVGFDVFDDASLLYVTQSPPGAEGSFYYNLSTFSRRYVVAEDNDPGVFHDKNFIAADIYPSSPNKGNVYVTWTVFKFNPNCGPGTPTGDERYCESPIFGSMSTDGGRHFSTPEEISGTSDALCFFGDFFNNDPARGHACNFDQGSDPVVLPNGDLEVTFNNGNTPPGDVNAQQLSVHCHPTGNSATGTAHLNCAEPAKVGTDFTTGEPQCDFGRGPEECIPGAYIRTNDFPRILTENTQNGHLYTVWQDYRNGEFDIQLSESVDGGLTWSYLGTVNPDRGLDHYFPATDQSPNNGDRIGVSYYRTERIPNENVTPPGGFMTCNQLQGGDPTACNAGTGLGNSDYVLAGGTGLSTLPSTLTPSQFPTPFDFKVVSPVFPPPNGIQTGFNGDYSGLVINKGTDAHPIWSDTRNVNPYAENGVVNDEDVFTDNVGLPNGVGKPTVGTIGKR